LCVLFAGKYSCQLLYNCVRCLQIGTLFLNAYDYIYSENMRRWRVSAHSLCDVTYWHHAAP